MLLALLLHRGAPLAKDRLVDLLWDGRPPTGSMATLETYVCLLREKQGRRFRPSRPGCANTHVAGCYAIDMARVDLDVDRYDRLVGTALRPEVSAVAALPMLREAMSLGRAPLLPEEPDDGWLAEARRAHAHRMHRGLVEAAAKVAGLPNSDGWTEAALEVDPLDESAWLALLRSHEASGQHADGVRAYERCRRLYAAELGCSPGAGLQGGLCPSPAWGPRGRRRVQPVVRRRRPAARRQPCGALEGAHPAARRRPARTGDHRPGRPGPAPAAARSREPSTLIGTIGA